MPNRPDIVIGIDIAEARGCAVAAIDSEGAALGATWSDSGVVPVREAVAAWSEKGAITGIGIDAPRRPLPSKRVHYWNGARGMWRSASEKERGHGRHCELVISALRLANPQWTPLGDEAPAWMQLGFEIFADLEPRWAVYEVFPSASYSQLRADTEARLNVSFQGFASNPKDVLDAYVAAVTVREFLAGRGCAVGGGDGLGEIVLPRCVSSPESAVHRWPMR